MMHHLQIVTCGGISLELVNDREGRIGGNGQLTIIPEELSTCKDDIELQFMGECSIDRRRKNNRLK